MNEPELDNSDAGSAPVTGKQIRTFGDLLASGFVGEWRDRDDIADSAEYARALRESTWRRASVDDSGLGG